MNLSSPIVDVSPGARGLVLQAITRSERGVSGRELARRAGLPVSTTAGVLLDLVESGIVDVESRSNGNGYALNQDHLLAGPIIAMAQVLYELTRQIQERVTGWGLQPVGGWLYGSAARGDGDRDSDVDLFFVLPNGYDHDAWEMQTAELTDYVNRRTGNWVQILPHTLGSFMDLERSGSVFTANLRVDGIDLVDGSWRRIAEAARRGAA